jgi:hypothetical protein
MTTAHTANEKGHGCDPVPFQNHTANDLDFPTGGRPSKALATIKAKFALRGHGVYDGDNHDFIVVHVRWSHSRYCRDYAALIGFGRQLGVL